MKAGSLMNEFRASHYVQGDNNHTVQCALKKSGNNQCAGLGATIVDPLH